MIASLYASIDQTFLKIMMHRFFDKWVEEFQHIERSLGGEA